LVLEIAELFLIPRRREREWFLGLRRNKWGRQLPNSNSECPSGKGNTPTFLERLMGSPWL
jgi:hypothetical protein